MKKLYIHLLFFTFSLYNLNAQFTDDMESYTPGQPISQDHWTDWGCGGGAGCAIMSVSGFAHTGSQSGLIPDDGTTDAVLDLGNKIFGEWCLSFYMYVPTGKEAYWNLQGTVPIGAGEWIVGNIFFNRDNLDPGHGYIDWSTADTSDDTYFDFPHDQWFRVIVNVDITTGISSATWQFGVDQVEVVAFPTPFADGTGTYPTSLGGINFYSINAGTNKYYLDDFVYDHSCYTGGLNELDAKGFSYFPNPINNELHIKADEIITNVSIFNMLGQEVYTKNIDETTYIIDTSDLTNGTYFLEVTIGDSVGSVKIIK